ncbi:pilus assembly protein CblD [Serratia sp. AXJ-M]|uniref:CfaE/CblD family pilus tip adhesin n=1 Tax=Serratia sp. AXJ-M TaxID=2754727 RepID=UPI00397841D2
MNAMLERMIKKVLCHSLLLMAVASLPVQALIIPPADNHQVINLSYDKSAPPADSYIWNRASGGTDDSTIGSSWNWRNGAWQCLSATDTTNGACTPVGTWAWDEGPVPSALTLRFTEKRSHMSVDIKLLGFNESQSPATDCWAARYSAPRAFWSGGYYARWCDDGHKKPKTAGLALTLWLPQAELAKIPTGGSWQAKLVLSQQDWVLDVGPIHKVATFSADITLNVTDKNNGAIYLPAFGSATPRVDLNLRTKPLSTAPGGEVSGQSNIDMCLYDGYNSNSPWLKVTLADQQSVAGRAADVFSVSRDGSSATATADRIDYRVTLNYNNQPQKVNNGQAITLTGVNTALIRPVVLPGIPFPVVCTPAPLTLDVLPFAKLSKAAGHFTGTLRVTLSADALAP